MDVYREKIEKIIENRKKAHLFFASKSEVYRTFLELEKKTLASGNLDKKNKELIALGSSIVNNCESCIEWHLGEALKAHATEAEILETIDVGIEMGGRPATVSARFALQALEYHLEKK